MTKWRVADLCTLISLGSQNALVTSLSLRDESELNIVREMAKVLTGVPSAPGDPGGPRSPFDPYHRSEQIRSP